jgi:hypothetical protein
VHKDVMVDGTCGFDQWADNHYAYDVPSDVETPIDIYVDNAKKNGLEHHWW